MGTRQHVDPERPVHQAPPRLRRSERRAASCVDAASRAWRLLAREHSGLRILAENPREVSPHLG